MSFLITLIQLDLADQKKILPRIRDLQSFTKNRLKERDEIYMRLNDTTKNLVDLFEACTFIRLYRANTFSRSWYEALPILETLAQKLEVSESELRSFTPPEILDALDNNYTLDKKCAMRRKQRFVIRILNDHYEQFEGQAAEDIVTKELPLEQTGLETILRGSCAYPGVVKGLVRIIYHPKQVNEITPGSVLVCRMTDPDFIVAMSKAGAIVTEEGGITCHAAIVSREMKKPCVIGTKVATKVLKDGDLVEVDAGKGVVRKLEK